MNMNQLRSLAKGRNLRGYSKLRKADLINFLHENEPSPPLAKDELPIEQPQNDKTNTLTKRQLKRRRNKASKLSKKSKNLRIEIDDLKSQKDDLEDKISKASSSTSARFKRNKVRSMKREATKITERIREQTDKLRTIDANPIQQSSQPLKMNKRIKKKIEDLNREEEELRVRLRGM